MSLIKALTELLQAQGRYPNRIDTAAQVLKIGQDCHLSADD
ncbi:hypothetical protein DFO67_12417 [Modicisalibacter xianhensis]|uniref:Uncharacterized protein n=1 Tax=Modicisalibacter xianhensis TaxID=442341 RepID=A0A4R8FD13_9GAMM|nr:hypothetical protein [Halomonas xianhensis]TDX23700.1 hypothetical protein DFO67_12417 [Halomonas xianhensis]